MAINDVKSRYEKTEDSAPKKLPLPEREHRRAHQQTVLAGIKIEGNLEPSHSLVDAAMNIREEDIIKYICPTICISREQEVKGLKKETLIKADSQGQLRSITQDSAPGADISSEYRLRLALQRRSLALDQMELVPYQKMEDYHNYMYDLLLRPVPSTHKNITVGQLLEADKHIWARVAEYCREGLKVTAAGVYPMESALSRAMLDPITTSLLQPLPSGSSYHAVKEYQGEVRQAPWQDSRKGKAGGKGGKGGKGKKGGKTQSSYQRTIGLPEGLQGSSVTKGGQRICFGFNLGTCNANNCSKGQHVCCKCFQKGHSFQNCPGKN